MYDTARNSLESWAVLPENKITWTLLKRFGSFLIYWIVILQAFVSVFMEKSTQLIDSWEGNMDKHSYYIYIYHIYSYICICENLNPGILSWSSPPSVWPNPTHTTCLFSTLWPLQRLLQNTVPFPPELSWQLTKSLPFSVALFTGLQKPTNMGLSVWNPPHKR